MSSSFSPSLLSSSFNSSTDPKALDFGTLVAIEEVPKPSGFTAGAGAKDASVTGAEATGGAGKVVVSSALSSFFSFFLLLGLVFSDAETKGRLTVATTTRRQWRKAECRFWLLLLFNGFLNFRSVCFIFSHEVCAP